MKHFTAAEIATAREQNPDHALVELITGGDARLVAIPMPANKRTAPVPSMPGMTLELLDGATITVPAR